MDLVLTRHGRHGGSSRTLPAGRRLSSRSSSNNHRPLKILDFIIEPRVIRQILEHPRLDADGRDGLYVASDDQREVRRYRWSEEGWELEVRMKFEADLGRFTWNVTPVPVSILSSES